MSDDRIGKTYSFDVCAPCKLICCQDANPPVTQKRMKIITEYLKTQGLPAEDVFIHEGHMHPRADAAGVCVFYNKGTRKCIVHPVKPETCKAGPITFDINLRTRKIELYLKKGELCVLAGIIYENKEQFKAHFEAAKEEIMQLIRDIESNDLKDILTIEEPQTFKVAEIDLPKDAAKKLAIE